MATSDQVHEASPGLYTKPDVDRLVHEAHISAFELMLRDLDGYSDDITKQGVVHVIRKRIEAERGLA